MAEQASNCFERGCCRLNLRPCTESDEDPILVIVEDKGQRSRPASSERDDAARSIILLGQLVESV